MEHGSDFEMKGNIADQTVNIEIYRKHVRTYLDLHLYTAALFWADKALSISNGDPQDVYWLAQCMFLLKQYHRAAHLIRSRNLDKSHSLCHYLAVRSLLEARDFGDALQLLTAAETENSLSCTVESSGADTSGGDVRAHGDIPANLQSGILYLKGRVLEATENRGLAADCYRQALRCDVYCYEAFDALVQHHMLSSWEEQELLDMLPYSQQCSSPTEARLLRELYETKLNKYQGPRLNGAVGPSTPSVSVLKKSSNILDTSDVSLNRSISGNARTGDPGSDEDPPLVERLLSSNLDVIVSKAERLYYNCNYRQCFRLTEDVLKKDPYHLSCLPVHIGCLVELKKTNQLFCLAHRLVDLHPEMAISWFAVGCYYYLKEGSSDPARRFLGKATSLNRLFGPAWLAFGHSFAADNEHDQAMAAYFKASQLMKGCHLPLLYIGLECGLTNNIKLAEKFFQQAQSIAPQDPFVIHEIGVIAFQNQDYEAAERHFEDALARVRAIDDGLTEKWEPLLNNLGHVSRKRGKFQKAIDYHQQALVLNPLSPSTYSAMGYAHAILGNTAEAVDCFHKALGLRTDDTFSTTMLTYVIEELADKSQPFKDAPEGMPRLKAKSGPRSNVYKAITFEDQSSEDNSMSLEFEAHSSTPLNVAPSASSPVPIDQYSSQLSFEVEMQDINEK